MSGRGALRWRGDEPDSRVSGSRAERELRRVGCDRCADDHVPPAGDARRIAARSVAGDVDAGRGVEVGAGQGAADRGFRCGLWAEPAHRVGGRPAVVWAADREAGFGSRRGALANPGV
eukprot:TRINITY_DN14334_c0_g1_i1.p3 TRINITY_DN14334_c0_g1~~TRINITY_DN14334_c0_g1_i1.p3  ORF type:complete len:118 (+),score=12.06 TRINITY_DN14334_c0_g1_i1:193-546(+)